MKAGISNLDSDYFIGLRDLRQPIGMMAKMMSIRNRIGMMAMIIFIRIRID